MSEQETLIPQAEAPPTDGAESLPASSPTETTDTAPAASASESAPAIPAEPSQTPPLEGAPAPEPASADASALAASSPESTTSTAVDLFADQLLVATVDPLRAAATRLCDEWSTFSDNKQHMTARIAELREALA